MDPSYVAVTRRIEEMSGIRPITVLIASGIVLITAILMVTGVAANHLRQQALVAAASESVRLDALLAEVSDRALRAVDIRLAEVADRLSDGSVGDAASFRAAAAKPEVQALLRSELSRFPRVAALALIAADGAVVDHAGAWSDAASAEPALIASLQAQPAWPSIVGAPIRDPQSGTVSIPLVRRVGAAERPLGAVVAMLPESDFTSLFSAIPLAHGGAIMVLRQNGSILVRYPEQPGAEPFSAGSSLNVEAMLADRLATIVRRITVSDSTANLEALQTLANFPVAIAVTRNANEVLAEWAHQGRWLGAFATVLSVAIGIMVYLIARQFKTHDALAAVRAEKIELERARLAAEAEVLKSERLSVLGQLTATVAHELRNPLSAIRNTLFTVKELVSNAGITLDRPISRMERSIERCDRIISDLLEYTRHRELARSAVLFDRWIADLLSEQTIAPPVMLVSELHAEDAVVPIDADRFRRVVINLVENAAQAVGATPPASEKRITVRTAIIGGQLEIVIEDTGPGIPPENLERIFEPLFSTKSFGTGLGLPTVKQIVNQHDGTIAVDSEVGSSTRVSVRLPLRPVTIQDVKVAA